jgi:hypothetical protein
MYLIFVALAHILFHLAAESPAALWRSFCRRMRRICSKRRYSKATAWQGSADDLLRAEN